MTPLSGLTAKLEAAKEGSRELDALIAVTIFETQKTDDDLIYARECTRSDNCTAGTYWHVQRSGMSLRTAPHYTASIDAALTLVPEGWGFNIHGSPREHNCCQSVSLMRGDPPYFDTEEIEAAAATCVLALCIAALKAREARR